jgi:DNA gyrase subunit A
MATNIPPHNLGELCDAVVALIDDPLLSDEALFRIIPAPDFPTGGQIMGLSGAAELYKTGTSFPSISASILFCTEQEDCLGYS